MRTDGRDRPEWVNAAAAACCDDHLCFCRFGFSCVTEACPALFPCDGGHWICGSGRVPRVGRRRRFHEGRNGDETKRKTTEKRALSENSRLPPLLGPLHSSSRLVSPCLKWIHLNSNGSRVPFSLRIRLTIYTHHKLLISSYHSSSTMARNFKRHEVRISVLRFHSFTSGPHVLLLDLTCPCRRNDHSTKW